MKNKVAKTDGFAGSARRPGGPHRAFIGAGLLTALPQRAPRKLSTRPEALACELHTNRRDGDREGLAVDPDSPANPLLQFRSHPLLYSSTTRTFALGDAIFCGTSCAALLRA